MSSDDLLSILDEIGSIDGDSSPQLRSQTICRLCPLLLASTDSTITDDDLVAVVLYLNQEIQTFSLSSASSQGISVSSGQQVCAFLQVGLSMLNRLNNINNNNNKRKIDESLLGELTSFAEAALSCFSNNNNNIVTSSLPVNVVASVKLSALRLIPAIVSSSFVAVFRDDALQQQLSDAVVKAIASGLRDSNASVVISTLEVITRVLLALSTTSATATVNSMKEGLVSTLCEAAGTSLHQQKKNNNSNLELFLSSAAAEALSQTLQKLSGISTSIKKLSGLLTKNNNSKSVSSSETAEESSSLLMQAFLLQQQESSCNDGAGDNDDDDDFTKLPQLIRPQMIHFVEHSDPSLLLQQQQQNDSTGMTTQQQKEADERDLQAKIEAVIRSLKQIPLSGSGSINGIEQWHLDGLRHMQQRTARVHMQAELRRLQEYERRRIASIPVGQLLTALPSCADTLEVATQLHTNEYLRASSMTALATSSVAAFPTVNLRDQPRCAAVISRLVSKLPPHCVDRVLDEILETLSDQVELNGGSLKPLMVNSVVQTLINHANNARKNNQENNNNSNNKQDAAEGNNAEENDDDDDEDEDDLPFASYRLMVQVLYSLYSQLALSDIANNNNNKNEDSPLFFDDGEDENEKQENNNNNSEFDEDLIAFEQDLIASNAQRELDNEDDAASTSNNNNNNNADNEDDYFGGFNLRSPLSWVLEGIRGSASRKNNSKNSSSTVVQFQEDTYLNAAKSSLGHATLRFLHFIFDLATSFNNNAKSGASVPLTAVNNANNEYIQQVMTQVLIDLPVIPTSAWLFLNKLASAACTSSKRKGVAETSAVAQSFFGGPAPSANAATTTSTNSVMKPVILCTNGLRILHHVAVTRPSDTWKALSFLLYYTRSRDRFPRIFACAEVVSFLQKYCHLTAQQQLLDGENNNTKPNDDNNNLASHSPDQELLLMESGIDEEKIFLRKVIGKFALFSANACCESENKELVTAIVEKQKQLQDAAAAVDASTTSASSSSSSALLANPATVAMLAQKHIVEKTTEEFHCHITLAARIGVVDCEVAEEFVKFLLDTYVREPLWHPALLHAGTDKEVDRLFRALCDSQNINRVLDTIRDFYPASSEPFVSHLLFLTKEKIFEIATDTSKNSNNGNPELADQQKRVAAACARTLKRHCDALVAKSHDVRFWCHAAAFHSPQQLRRQTIPAITSCFDNAETTPDAEAGLRNCVAATAFFMGGRDGADRGISVSDLLEHLIVMSAPNSNNNNIGGANGGNMMMMMLNNNNNISNNKSGGGLLDIADNTSDALSASGTTSTDTTSGVNISITFSTAAQQRAIAKMIDFVKPTPVRIVQEVLEKLRMQQQQQQHQQQQAMKSADGKSHVAGAAAISATAFTPPLFMYTINLLLSRDWPDTAPLRRFASGVARGLVIGEVWAHDAELWHGVQVYLEQEAKHLASLIVGNNLMNMTAAQHQQLSVNQQHLLVVVQALPRRTLKEMVSSRPFLKNFVKQYQELRDVLD